MSEGIVDGLEAVQIQEQDGQFVTVQFGPLDLPTQVTGKGWRLASPVRVSK